MVCYIVPATAAIVHYGLRKKINRWKDDKYQQWLSLLLLGGSIFGIVDHLWNGELFLLGEKPMLDIMLGLTITLAILFVWLMIVILDKSIIKNNSKIPIN